MNSATRDADAAASLVMAPPSTKFAAPLECEPRSQQQQPHDVDSASEESNISCNDKLGELLILRAGRTGAPGPVSELIRPDTAKTAGLRKKASITSKRKLVTPQGSATLKAPRVAGSLTRTRPGTLLHADSSEDEEVAELLLGMGSRPVLGCISTPPASSAAASRASSPTKKAEPSRLPLADGSPKATKRKGGAQNGLETIGRCKCGKKISAAHPACKSELMLLCEKFQAVFGRAGAEEIQLNEAAVRLNVARRRLYDIINVLEAVEIISRTGKLTYQWRGMEHLPRLLERLVEEETAGTPAVRARKGHNQGSKNAGDQTDKPLTFSLWMLSRHFVRLLLSSAEPIPLADVSSMLVGEDAPRRAQTMVTVERRLYDIGSILSSIGLIKKTYVGKRQPAFCWSAERGVPQPVLPAARAAPKEKPAAQYTLKPPPQEFPASASVPQSKPDKPIQPAAVKPEAIHAKAALPPQPEALNVPLMTANLSSLASSLSMASAAASMWPTMAAASGAMTSMPMQLGLPQPLPGMPPACWQSFPMPMAGCWPQAHLAFATTAHMQPGSAPSQFAPNGSLPMALQCAPLGLRSDLPPSIMLPGVSTGMMVGPPPALQNMPGQSAPGSLPFHWYLNGPPAFSACK